MHDGGARVAATDAIASHAGHGAAQQTPDDEGRDHSTCMGDCAGAAQAPLAPSSYPVSQRIVTQSDIAPAAAFSRNRILCGRALRFALALIAGLVK